MLNGVKSCMFELRKKLNVEFCEKLNVELRKKVEC